MSAGCPVWRAGAEIRTLQRVLLIIYFVEVGVVLVIAPWTQFWERNYFVDGVPVVQAVLTAPWSRGLISGIGVVSLCAAITEIVGWRRRRGAARLTLQPDVASPSS